MCHNLEDTIFCWPNSQNFNNWQQESPFPIILLDHHIVQQIGAIIVLFNDTSMKFGIQLENDLRNIFSYRAISDFSP